MFGSLKKLFAPRANPIGVDFGADCLRLAQVRFVDKEYRLVAAASADVPAHLRDDLAGRWAFFSDTTRDLLAQGEFIGRQAILSLPASQTHIQHLRMPKLDEEALGKALAFELRGKLPIDPTTALLRHVSAGELFNEQDPKIELIVMAAQRDYVERYLDVAGRCKLDVVGMNVEPRVLVDCFEHIYRRKTDAETTNCFVDIGATATRVVIARQSRLLFARCVPIAGDQFAAAVARGLSMDLPDARALRIKLASLIEPAKDRNEVAATQAPAQTQARAAESSDAPEHSFALLGAAMQSSRKRHGEREQNASDSNTVLTAPDQSGHWQPSAAPPARTTVGTTDPVTQARQVEQLVDEPLNRLIHEIDLCRRYYESTFPNKPVDRLVFVGGESHNRGLCQHIAKQLSLSAQIGDPLTRMGRLSDIGIESGIDRRQPQPAWAVAIGLSLGPTDDGAKGDE